MRAIRRILILLLIVLPIVGCSQGGNPDLVPLDVKVLLDEKPIEEAVVIFISEDGRYANGLTNSNGVAEMTTFEPGDGVHPGKYQVGIDKSQLIEESDPNDPTGNTILKSETTFHIPPKYGDPINSGLTAEVTREGEREIVFNLSK